ncbi:MAG TPA: HAD family hydrolase [Methylotenera sp.]|nr:HAD family hydrolase [Methylotenera sp.]
MMIKAVLLDMDNTLLVNPDIIFAKAFLEQFDQHMKQQLQVEQASVGFRQAIQRMSQARDGSESNIALILRTLCEFMQRDTETIQAAWESFYAEKYPTLREYISTVAGASDLIQKLVADGFQVVIATNPIYPETAIKQRMVWANLPTDDNLYTLITHAENMHSAKPNPAYFAEILKYIGVEPHEALMVGDSLKSDIIPAQTLGIHTYQIHDHALTAFIDNLSHITEK